MSGAAQDDLEQRIRERAFFLWQEAGCPEGRAEEFWYRAREMEAGSEQTPKTPSATPNERVDQAGKDSFPASDPTSYV
jgi:hypothetical protein